MSFCYIRWEQNYISKLHSMMTHILMPWFKESTERRETRFVKKTVKNVDLHKAVLNKKIIKQEYCLKYDFVAPLNRQARYLLADNVPFRFANHQLLLTNQEKSDYWLHDYTVQLQYHSTNLYLLYFKLLYLGHLFCVYEGLE